MIFFYISKLLFAVVNTTEHSLQLFFMDGSRNPILSYADITLKVKYVTEFSVKLQCWQHIIAWPHGQYMKRDCQQLL